MYLEKNIVDPPQPHSRTEESLYRVEHIIATVQCVCSHGMIQRNNETMYLEKNIVDPPQPHSRTEESLYRVEHNIATVSTSNQGILNYNKHKIFK